MGHSQAPRGVTSSSMSHPYRGGASREAEHMDETETEDAERDERGDHR